MYRKERSDITITRQIQLPDPDTERAYCYPGYTLTGEELRPIRAISSVHLCRDVKPEIYEIGKTNTVPVDPDPEVECAAGIHFYAQRDAAFCWIPGLSHVASSDFRPPRPAATPSAAPSAAVPAATSNNNNNNRAASFAVASATTSSR